MYSLKQDVGKLQGCFYFGNGISHNLSRVQQIQDGGLHALRMLRYRSEDMEISHVINNMDCICSLATHALNLKCFMIDLKPLTQVETSLRTWDDTSLETCGNLLTNAHLWKSFVKLQVLQLRRCSFLTLFPKEIIFIATLMEIDLEGCSNLTTIQEELGNLSSLASLNLS
jgi:leucine-rich repeat protein SHOC2